MRSTSTAARSRSPWTAAAARGLCARAPAVAELASVAVVVVVLAGCGQGGTAPGAATDDSADDAADDVASTTLPTAGATTDPGDDMDASTPADPSGLPHPSGLPEPSALPVPPGGPAAPALLTDPAGADLVLVAGPPGAQQPPVTLVCDWVAGASSGTHPQADRACADLLAAVQAGDPFAPVAPDAMCTQQYGGDAVVEVTGALRAADGAPVDVAATYTLSDGCQISRFDALGTVLAPFRGTV